MFIYHFSMKRSQSGLQRNPQTTRLTLCELFWGKFSPGSQICSFLWGSEGHHRWFSASGMGSGDHHHHCARRYTTATGATTAEVEKCGHHGLRQHWKKWESPKGNCNKGAKAHKLPEEEAALQPLQDNPGASSGTAESYTCIPVMD